MTAPIVAVDVGNSAIKLQAFQPQPQRPAVAQTVLAVPHRHADWADRVRQYRHALARADDTAGDRQRARFAGASPLGPPAADDPAAPVDGHAAVVWRVASVNMPASDRLRQLVRRHWPGDAWRPVGWRDVPLRVDVHQPQAVGIDRLLGGWAAWRRVAADVVVVDAGSAVTVDLVDRAGTFRGGAILPGMGMQYHALGTGTAALPDLHDPPAAAGESASDLLLGPGRDTVQAIRLGVTTGIVAAIARLAEIYRTSVDSPLPLPIVLTGGDALRLASLLEPRPLVVPGLVVEGLAALPLKDGGGESPV